MPSLTKHLLAGLRRGVLLLFCASPVANAQESARLQKQVQLCAGCHGENGVPQEKTTPIIWGQTLGYQYLQLRDYKNGDRKNEKMTPVVEMLERQDLLALAEYFSKQAWPRNPAPPVPPDVAERAARANTAVGCTGCHQGQYQGEGTQPRLAGQNEAYMSKTMLEIRTGERANNPGMTTLMKATSLDDIKALAQYLAALEVGYLPTRQ
jgi:cytochrome c553